MRKFNKKGVSIDNLWVIVSFFVLVIFFIGVMLFWNGVKDLTADLWGQSSIGMDIRENAQNAVDGFDFILLMAYFALHIGVLVLTFLLRTHPVMYVAGIIIIAILCIVAAPLSNAYEDFKEDSNIVTVTADIPMTNYIIDQLPMFEVIWGFITAIVMFGLARYEGFI